jgi:NAD(P)-dependent dehydrogenase (short-subunit alcohol dehydrogenase family)
MRSARGGQIGHAFHCDLAAPDWVRGFAAAMADRTSYLDVLINNGAAYIEGDDLEDVSDDTIESVMASFRTGRCRQIATSLHSR